MKWWLFWIAFAVLCVVVLVALVIGSAATSHIFDVPTPRP